MIESRLAVEVLVALVVAEGRAGGPVGAGLDLGADLVGARRERVRVGSRGRRRVARRRGGGTTARRARRVRRRGVARCGRRVGVRGRVAAARRGAGRARRLGEGGGVDRADDQRDDTEDDAPDRQGPTRRGTRRRGPGQPDDGEHDPDRRQQPRDGAEQGDQGDDRSDQGDDEARRRRGVRGTGRGGRRLWIPRRDGAGALLLGDGGPAALLLRDVVGADSAAGVVGRRGVRRLRSDRHGCSVQTRSGA